jgi:hypothetical protein
LAPWRSPRDVWPGDEPSLEQQRPLTQAPSVAHVEVVEAGNCRSVTGAAERPIDGFLDGVQESRVVAHIDASPVVMGHVQAVLLRRDTRRRLRQWQPPSSAVLLVASRSAVGASAWRTLVARVEAEGGLGTVADLDTNVDADGEVVVHPLAVRLQATSMVSARREALERTLAREWMTTATDDGDDRTGEERLLWVDGPVPDLDTVERATTEPRCSARAARRLVGVVKSHAVLYGDAAFVRAVLALSPCARSPVFRVHHRRRRAIVSWYLRLAHPPASDPLHALVRLECTHTDDAAPAPTSVAALADRVSRAVLTERTPIALPDHRWDVMPYGVQACESLLKGRVA